MTANHEAREEMIAMRAWHFSKLRERRSSYPLIGFLFLVAAVNNLPDAIRGDVVSIVAVVLSLACGVLYLATRPRKRGVVLGVRYEFTRDGVEMEAIRTYPTTRTPPQEAQNRP